MLKQSLIILTLIVLISCNDDSENINLQQDLKSDTSTKALQILFSQPQIIDSTPIVIYPLLFERTTYGSSYGSSGDGEIDSYWNILFYNTETAKQHLLVADKKLLIYSIDFSGSSSSYNNELASDGISVFKKKIIYKAVSKDFNANNQLDQNDPRYLYISDEEGNDFRQISPEDYNIISWEIIKGTPKIILQGQKDNNGDKKFDTEDPVIPLIVDLTSTKTATETFDSTYLDTVRSELIKIWKPKK